MNILFLTYQGDIAGSTNSIFYLATGLSKIGHDVFVGCRKESLLTSLLEGTRVTIIPMTFARRFDLRNARHIAEVVEKHKIDIVNAQSSYDRYTSVLAKYLYGAKTVVVHTRRQISKSMGGFFQNLFYYRGTDRVIAVSQGVKNSLIKGGIPDYHIKVIHNGTPSEKYEILNNEQVVSIQNKLGIQQNDFVLGCVSRLKNQIQIVEALQYIDTKMKVIFVGIEEQVEFERFVKEHNLPHELHYEGVVPGEEVLNYYPVFDINILASTQEGLSQAILESMALGTPVIATNYSGNPELIKESYNGMLFEDKDSRGLAEKILALKNDSILRNQIIEHAKKTALEDFSIEKTIKKYDEFFRELLKASG